MKSDFLSHSGMSIESKPRNPQHVEEYSSEIINFLLSNQNKNQMKFRKIENLQNDITEKMRSILVDWLIDVHAKFKLRDETLFLTINLIDRFIAKHQISKQKLQLVGVSSMLIACKYEEIYAPEVKDFVYVTDNAYSRDEVMRMEALILEELGFSLFIQSPKLFLERFLYETHFSEKAKMLSRYVLELSLLDFNSGKHSPLMLAAGSVYLAAKLFKENNPWPSTLADISSLEETEVRPAAKELCMQLQNADKCAYQSVKRKFSSSKYLSISKVQLEKK